MLDGPSPSTTLLGEKVAEEEEGGMAEEEECMAGEKLGFTDAEGFRERGGGTEAGYNCPVGG